MTSMQLHCRADDQGTGTTTSGPVTWMTCPHCGAASADADTLTAFTLYRERHACPVCAHVWFRETEHARAVREAS